MRPVKNTRASGHRQVVVAWGLGATLCIAVCAVANGQTGEVLSVQPASVNDGSVELYGIVRRLGDHPSEDGTTFAIQVTAADSDATTDLRLEADGKPCPDCTTTHYFLVREPGKSSPEILSRAAPGPITYIRMDGREYMIGSIDLSWTDDGKPRLERSTLWQTGFTPPALKRKVRLRFGAPVASDLLVEDIAEMAKRDAMERGRISQQAYEAAVRRESEARDTP